MRTQLIRQELVAAGNTFIYDIEAEEFDALLISWSNSSDSTASPTRIVCCPTMERHGGAGEITDDLSNFPGIPGPPGPGEVSYAAIGIGCITAVPLPQTVSVGLTAPTGCNCSVKILGQRRPNYLKSPVSDHESRS